MLLFLPFLVVFYACNRGSSEGEAMKQEVNETKQESAKKPLFKKIKPEHTKVNFKNEIQETPYRNILAYQYYYNGGGVAIGDINNDGLPDIFFTGNTVPNRLYLNKGSLEFEDVTEGSGIVAPSGPGWCTGTTMVDINHDGWLDIYVCRSGNLEPQNRTNLLYVNNGDGTFTEKAKEFGLDDPGYSIQAVFFDYDKDGDLDMFLINHGLEYDGHPPVHASSKRDPYVGDKLYRNDNGKFVDVSETAGIIGTKEGYGLGVAVGDLNNNGWEDIYVSNDFFEHDYLYLNNGDGTFKESMKATSKQMSFFGMGVDIADYNNDGWQDVLVLDMAIEDHVRQKTNLAGISRSQFWQFVDKGYHYQYMFNSLQLNNGMNADGELSFSNVARMAGVFQTDWSWAPLFADFDNDGWKDLFISNGLRKDVMNNDFIAGLKKDKEEVNAAFTEFSTEASYQLLQSIPSQKVSNYAYRNNKDLTFEDVTDHWGLKDLTFSNGAAYADLDNDGDLDLVVNNIDDWASIYENQSDQNGNNYLRLKLNGPSTNPQGHGTKVFIFKDGNLQFQQFNPTRGYQSSVEPIVHFGVGEHRQLDSIRIEWYDNKVYVLENVPTNMTIQVDYRMSMNEDSTREFPTTNWFSELNTEKAKGDLKLHFKHQESDFSDFAAQNLIPRKYSTEGPVVITADVNGNGLDDLFFGGARGQASELWLQNQNGQFFKAHNQPWEQDSECEDVNALFFDMDGDGDLDLYVVSGSNEFEKGSPWLQDRIYKNDGKGNFSKTEEVLPDFPGNTSIVTAGDFDGDGDLDLFVGGGVVPGKYPAFERSFLLLNEAGKFKDVTEKMAPELINPGIVSDAIWTDYNQDGNLGLLIVGEWMPIRFFTFQNGSIQPDTGVNVHVEGEMLSDLSLTSGWWNCITPVLDEKQSIMGYMLGNMGLNYRFRPTKKYPLEIFAGDFEGLGTQNLILGYYFKGSLYPTHGREDISSAMPAINRNFIDYASYAKAKVNDILSVFPNPPSLHFKAHMFEHVFLQVAEDGTFSMVPLPMDAQRSSVKDILARDIDGDGKQEVVLVGNFYGIETKTPRDDAGIGSVLKFEENGEWNAIPMHESGFFAPNEARKVTYFETKNSRYLIIGNNNENIQIFSIESAQ